MNRDDMAIESFISYCDDMMIAEEGFKDGVKAGAGKVAKGAKFVGQKIMQFIRMLRDLIKRAVARIKGIRKETKVNSDKYFYVTKINKVRLSAITKAMKAISSAAKSKKTDEIDSVNVELKKCNKTEELWKKQLGNRKTKMIPINPAEITKILNENNALLNQIEQTLGVLQNVYGVEGMNSPLYSPLSQSLQLVKKTISEATSLVSNGANSNKDMNAYGQKHGDATHRAGRKASDAMGDASSNAFGNTKA